LKFAARRGAARSLHSRASQAKPDPAPAQGNREKEARDKSLKC
jgi:hypothetical protein